MHYIIEVITIEETIRLKCDETGRLAIHEFSESIDSEILTKKCFSTPDLKGQNFARLFSDVKEGDIIEITFKTIRVCSQCGQKLITEK